MDMIVIAALRKKKQIRKKRIFRDRLNPFDSYDDDQIYRRFRFHRPQIIHIVDMVKDTIEFPLKRKGSLRGDLALVITHRCVTR